MPSSLIFGGYDRNRFIEPALSCTLNPSEQPSVAVQAITVSGNATATLLDASQARLFTIDSSTPYFWMPEDVCESFAKHLNLTYDESLRLYTYGSDSQLGKLNNANISFTFTLADSVDSGHAVNITIPFDAFHQKLTYPYPNLPRSALKSGLSYFPLRKLTNSTHYTLGRAFLQEAYLIVDYGRSNFSLSQARFEADAVSNTDIVSISGITDSRDGGTGAGGGGGGTNVILSQPSSGLNMGAKVGIGIGVGAAVLGVVAGVVATYLLFKVRRTKAEQCAVQDKTGDIVGSGGVDGAAMAFPPTDTGAGAGAGSGIAKWLPAWLWPWGSRARARAREAREMAARQQPVELGTDRQAVVEVPADESTARYELPANEPVELPTNAPRHMNGVAVAAVTSDDARGVAGGFDGGGDVKAPGLAGAPPTAGPDEGKDADSSAGETPPPPFHVAHPSAFTDVEVDPDHIQDHNNQVIFPLPAQHHHYHRQPRSRPSYIILSNAELPQLRTTDLPNGADVGADEGAGMTAVSALHPQHRRQVSGITRHGTGRTSHSAPSPLTPLTAASWSLSNRDDSGYGYGSGQGSDEGTSTYDSSGTGFAFSTGSWSASGTVPTTVSPESPTSQFRFVAVPHSGHGPGSAVDKPDFAPSADDSGHSHSSYLGSFTHPSSTSGTSHPSAGHGLSPMDEQPRAEAGAEERDARDAREECELTMAANAYAHAHERDRFSWEESDSDREGWDGGSSQDGNGDVGGNEDGNGRRSQRQHGRGHSIERGEEGLIGWF